MGMFDFITNRFRRLEKKEAPLVMYQSGNQVLEKNYDYRKIAKEGYQENAIVFRCVNEIAHGASAVELCVYQGDMKLDSHPLITLLQRPNPQFAGNEYFQALYSFLLLSGNSYAVYSLVNSQPRELHLLRPDRVKIIPGKTQIPSAFEYVIDGRVVNRYNVDSETGMSDVKHFKMWNPLDDYYGLSPIQAASFDIDQHNMAAKHNLSLLMNGARPSGAVIFKPKDESGMSLQLSDSQRQQLMSDLNMRFSGSQNAGRPMLLEGDFDWKEMGLSPKDMDFLELKNMSARDIALCFGVPSQLVGVPDSQTYNNVSEARLALYEDTIIPLIRRVESDMNEWLAPRFGDDISIRYDIDSIPAMAERRKKTYENVVTAVREGIISRNEARERLGYEPINGGDDVYISANLFPLGAPTVAPAEGETAEDDDKYFDYSEEKREISKDVFTTEEEARERADEIGCDGFHSHRTEDGLIYMPCSSHSDYERLTGDSLETPKQDPRFGEGRDVFESVAEARERAKQLGCDGHHTVKGPDRNYYMPCSSHAIYLSTTKKDFEEIEKAESDVNTTPTDAMAEEARRGLDWRKEHGHGGTAVGLARARQLVNKERLSPRTVRRMFSFFARHEVDKRAEGFRPGEDGYPSSGRIAWSLWGGDAGFSWSRRKVKELDKERDKQFDFEMENLCCDDCGTTVEMDTKQISARTKKTLENKVKEHNEKHGDKKGKRVTLRMLSAVFRRGVGAYRTNPESVRRNVMGPDQWAIARVNAFLYAVRTGRFRSGKFDRDLLPSGHPLRSDK